MATLRNPRNTYRQAGSRFILNGWGQNPDVVNLRLGNVYEFGNALECLVTTGGTFAAGTATSTFTGPGETWTVSFDVASNPVITSSILGVDFDVPIANFLYTFNGSQVNVSPVDVEFFSSSIVGGGAFVLCFFGCTAGAGTPPNGFEASSVPGEQYYSGAESAPTILTGSYAESALASEVILGTPHGTLQPNGTVTISAAPEPTTFLLTLACATLLALKRKALTTRRAM